MRNFSLHLFTDVVQEVEPASQTTTAAAEREDEESEDEPLIRRGWRL